MATEVSCGQCQGRLLVETLGVVVACPHCGTHLSIPAPEPTAAAPELVSPPTPEPPVLQFAAVPPPEPQPELTPAPVEVVAVNPDPVVSVASAPPETPGSAPVPPADDHHEASIFASTPETGASTPVGWHSTPNLHLSGEQAAIVDPVPQPLETSSATLLEPTAPTTPLVFDATVPPVPAEAVVQMPMSAATELRLSSTQHFSLGEIKDVAAAAEPAPAAAPLTFGAAPSTVPAPDAGPLTFGAAAASVPQPRPLTFGAAPAASATAPVTFGAAPASTSVPAPVTFGAAPVHLAVSTTVAEDVAAFAESELVQRQKFLFVLLVVVGSYASCVTIVLIYMLMRGQASNLESLPDLVPPRGENGQIGAVYNSPRNNVPLGHVLSLGQSRRFGNVKVTPLKVTRGPVKFEHFSSQPGMTREPTPPLLKLWVKFENVSRNQTFAPVDPYLLFTRNSKGLSGPTQANGFVATLANQRKGAPISLIYEMSKESEFRMVGQNLSVDLEPGEKIETFIPAEEDASDLSGDLVWRFQFRKGYNPKSHRGVTTLIDVRFSSRDIQEERGV